jgi:hypothetical protein
VYKLLLVWVGLVGCITGINLLVIAPHTWSCPGFADTDSFYTPDGKSIVLVRSFDAEVWRNTEDEPSTRYSFDHTRDTGCTLVSRR